MEQSWEQLQQGAAIALAALQPSTAVGSGWGSDAQPLPASPPTTVPLPTQLLRDLPQQLLSIELPLPAQFSGQSSGAGLETNLEIKIYLKIFPLLPNWSPANHWPAPRAILAAAERCFTQSPQQLLLSLEQWRHHHGQMRLTPKPLTPTRPGFDNASPSASAAAPIAEDFCLGSQLIGLRFGTTYGAAAFPLLLKQQLGPIYPLLLHLGDRLHSTWAGQADPEGVGVS
ncbi:MAG: hypothetical protein HC824_21750 [Synechococcales cyanobacterium RM1_1_8]|nr:hypothetical protein [Synechococcales cyanobacterium RM1_1_8]